MARKNKLDRRRFVKLCASALAVASTSPSTLAKPTGTLTRYQRVRLVDQERRPIRPELLDVGENYVFHYPYVATPCFLLDLGKPAVTKTVLTTEDNEEYLWRGGVGPNRSIVAFSAICAHKMSHPSQDISFINYRHQEVSFKDLREQPSQRARVIFCCSERSVYDPTRGAKVLGGPAKQPLATIVLEHNPEDGHLYATGTYGGEMFNRYFEKFAHRLTIEFESDDIHRRVSGSAVVQNLTDFCRQQVLC